MGWAVFRVVRVIWVPWPNTRTTRNNFGYRGLEPELGFGFFGFGLGFFGFGLRVSGNMPSLTCTEVLVLTSPVHPVQLELLSLGLGIARPQCTGHGAPVHPMPTS